MRDFSNSRLLFVKAVLFVIQGFISALLLITREPQVSTFLLLSVCIWSFARVYYFAFYVIEHYVDPSYRFSGLWSAMTFVCRRRVRNIQRSEVPPANSP
jgi:hypothetical protein